MSDLAVYIIRSRVYLSPDAGTVCITTWADGRMTAYNLTKGGSTNA